MNVLILGGTGAMGKHIAEILKKDFEITVTSRKKLQDENKIK